MEARKVLIVNNKTQSQKVINSVATTLGELKAEAISAGIDVDGMTWYEGHLRAEFADDASQLPATVTWRGAETNELTFLLTQPDKKVKSGAMSRQEVYNEIKRLGLQQFCKSVYGRNYTQCPTADLIYLIETHEANTPSPCGCTKVEINISDDNTTEALEALVEELYNNDHIDDFAYNRVKSLLRGEEQPLSRGDIDEMFDFVNK